MKIAIASGKGGTGKTTIAVNLAKILEEQGITYLDCDVEAPNGYLFLKPEIQNQWSCKVFIPEIAQDQCNHCGKCADLCQYHAIGVFKTKTLVFPELCHSCLGCQRICPEQAVQTGQKKIGTISAGVSGNIRFIQGQLKIGEAQSPPLIKEIRRFAESETPTNLTILDAPPGTSCPVIEAINETDFVVLVTEPTPFGLYDLKLAVDLAGVLGVPFGVVINRSTIGDRKVWEYCNIYGIPILGEIPDDRKIAEACSRGELLVDCLPQYRPVFNQLQHEIMKYVTTASGVAL